MGHYDLDCSWKVYSVPKRETILYEWNCYYTLEIQSIQSWNLHSKNERIGQWIEYKKDFVSKYFRVLQEQDDYSLVGSKLVGKLYF